MPLLVSKIEHTPSAVIGATGFIGNYITNELISRNHEVLGISRDEKASDKNNLTFISSDVLNVNKLYIISH